jgi:hypothetical protein
VPRATNNIEFGNQDPARHVSFVRAGGATLSAAKADAGVSLGLATRRSWHACFGMLAVLAAALQKPLRGIAGCGMI